MSRQRIAVLASGGGSNFQALLEHLSSLGDRRAGDIVVLAADRPSAAALDRARRAGIPTEVSASRLAPEEVPLARVIDRYMPDLIVLAGYLQHVPSDVTRAFAGRIVNVHPAPLPEFGGPGMYGARVHRALLSAGAAHSGPTVHFVDDEYDHGATIAHWSVPVHPGDDDRSLAARVLRAEHVLLPRVVQALAAGEIGVGEDGLLQRPFLARPLPPFDDTLDTDTLGRIVDAARAV